MLAPAGVGLFVALRRPGNRVAWILLAGALSVARRAWPPTRSPAWRSTHDPRLDARRVGGASSRRSGRCSSCGRSRSPTCSRTGACRRAAGARPRPSPASPAVGLVSLLLSSRPSSTDRTAASPSPLPFTLGAATPGCPCSGPAGSGCWRRCSAARRRCGARYRAGDAAAAPPGPVAGLRRAAAAAVARRRVARRAADRVDRRRRRPRPDDPAGLAGGRRRGRGDAPRPVRDRPAAQPDARLRRADARCWSATYALVALLVGLVVGGSALSASLATLAAALAFRPLRDRIQRLVDRRFARARFDAVRLLRDFLDAGARRPRRAGGRRRGARASRSATRRPRSCSACPRPAPTPTAAATCSTRCPTTGARAR